MKLTKINNQAAYDFAISQYELFKDFKENTPEHKLKIHYRDLISDYENTEWDKDMVPISAHTYNQICKNTFWIENSCMFKSADKVIWDYDGGYGLGYFIKANPENGMYFVNIITKDYEKDLANDIVFGTLQLDADCLYSYSEKANNYFAEKYVDTCEKQTYDIPGLILKPGDWIRADIIGDGIYEIVDSGINHGITTIDYNSKYIIVKCKKLFGQGLLHKNHETTCHPINDVVKWNNYKKLNTWQDIRNINKNINQ